MVKVKVLVTLILVTILKMQEVGAVAPVLNKVIVDSTHDRATHCPHCVPGISVPLMMLMFLLPPEPGLCSTSASVTSKWTQQRLGVLQLAGITTPFVGYHYHGPSHHHHHPHSSGYL